MSEGVSVNDAKVGGAGTHRRPRKGCYEEQNSNGFHVI
jgi:hypothetical protein